MVSANVGPDPLRREIGEQHVYQHRSLFCARYDACLDEAVRREWPSWTCAHCARFEARAAAPTGEHPQQLGAVAGRAAGHPDRVRSASSSEVTPEAAGVTVEPRIDAPRSTRRPAEPHGRSDDGPALGSSGPGLFIAAARELGRASGAPNREGASNHEELIAISAPDEEALLDRWIEELAVRSRRSKARFTEFDIVYLSERQLVASVRGVRAEDREHAAVAVSP